MYLLQEQSTENQEIEILVNFGRHRWNSECWAYRFKGVEVQMRKGVWIGESPTFELAIKVDDEVFETMLNYWEYSKKRGGYFKPFVVGDTTMNGLKSDGTLRDGVSFSMTAYKNSGDWDLKNEPGGMLLMTWRSISF